MTARWVVDEVAPERELDILWQPISLLEKNKPDPESDYYAPAAWSHGLLRVMEAVRAGEGDGAVQGLYWEYASRIHHDEERLFDPALALKAVGLPESYADAAQDAAFDEGLVDRMGQGLALTGDDVGTPIIAMDDDDGNKVGLFGPVITRVPPREQSLALWDGFVMMATTPGFWEVKRTRTERPEFGLRP